MMGDPKRILPSLRRPLKGDTSLKVLNKALIILI